jgi:hypothetical protein
MNKQDRKRARDAAKAKTALLGRCGREINMAAAMRRAAVVPSGKAYKRRPKHSRGWE